MAARDADRATTRAQAEARKPEARKEDIHLAVSMRIATMVGQPVHSSSLAGHVPAWVRYAGLGILPPAMGGRLPNERDRAERQARASLDHRQLAFLRDIFGNAFQGRTADRAWLTADVLSLAQAAYEDRLLPSGELALDRLSILADALEDANCTDEALLSHLRGPGPHVRGCWVVDLLLAKA